MLMGKNIYTYILLIFILINNVYAKESINNLEKLQILATKIETKGSIIVASDNVLIHSSKYYITAKKVLYDREKATLELFENVNIIKNGKTITFSEYAFLDFSKEIDTFEPVLLIDNSNNIWINSKKAKRDKNILKLDNSTLSSCDCYDPAWTISFSSGEFDTEDQWLNTYNTTLYINEIPVLYTPYFGFPTDKTRRTGLLRPTIGYSNVEGFIYAQPIYYASSLNWDLEYIPQHRTKRGTGHQLKYRFKDSNFSLLTIEGGTFKEQDDYFNKLNLRNKEHYGIDLNYNRTKLISDSSTQDGLLISLHSLNDIDYTNTKYNNENTSGDKLIESKIKYFYNTNNFYSDIDFNHYKDTSKVDNDDTMHELPKIHLHKYLTETNIDNLLYLSDIEYTNKTRVSGLEAQTTNVFIPLSYNIKFLDDFFNFSYSEEFNLFNIQYDQDDTQYLDGQFIENRHIVDISSDLLKAYDRYIHTINFRTKYTIPNIIKQNGDLYGITNDTTDLNVFPLTKTQENIDISLNQSFYSKNTKAQIINHKLSQTLIYDEDTNNFKKSNLENDITYFYKYGTFDNQLLYNYDINKITSSLTSLKFLNKNFNNSISYVYKKDELTLGNQENINYDLGFKFLKYYTASYNEEYDLTNEKSTKKEYSLDIDKKCWALNIKLSDNLIASSTINNSALRQSIVYLQLTLKPILTLNQQYVQKETEE